MIVIAISGKKRSGKNTVAKLIATLTPLKCQEFAFADELKVEIARICNTNVTEINRNKDSYRHLLQAWGVYRRDKNGADYWIDKTLRLMLNCPSPIAIVTDLRFRNEAIAMRDIGAAMVRVDRGVVSGDTHESETQLDNYMFDFYIDNTQSIDALVPRVKELLTKLNIPIKN